MTHPDDHPTLPPPPAETTETLAFAALDAKLDLIIRILNERLPPLEHRVDDLEKVVRDTERPSNGFA